MSGEIGANGIDSNSPPRGFDVDISLRGCSLSLSDIKQAYLEFQELTSNEGERIIGKLRKSDDQTQEQFDVYIARVQKAAFLVTTTIIGGEDNIQIFGDDYRIFENPNIPFPVKTIFFTNQNSFRWHANESLPANRFNLWLHFSKPPLIDSNPLLSQPTPNTSVVNIKADMLPFLRAAQRIAYTLKNKKTWYAPLHGSFTYDVGLWLFGLPYALFTVTSTADQFLPVGSSLETYRIPFFIYVLGLCLIAYRAFMSYLKWAFPVNILKDNKDTAWKHRAFFIVITVGLVGNLIWAILGKKLGLGG